MLPGGLGARDLECSALWRGLSPWPGNLLLLQVLPRTNTYPTEVNMRREAKQRAVRNDTGSGEVGRPRS